MRVEIIIDKEQKISQTTLDALESELYHNLYPLCPKTSIRIRKGSANELELNGLKVDEDKRRVMGIHSRSGRTKPGYTNCFSMMPRICMMGMSHQCGASMVSIMTKKSKPNEGGRFSLRLPSEMLESIDKECAKRVGCVSRNTWIAEAIAEKLSRAKSEPSQISEDNRAA